MPRSFKMSDAHMQAFSEQQRLRFEDEMVVHLQKKFPEETGRVSEDWLREMIREGTATAKGYDIVLEPDVARYLELMLALSPSSMVRSSSAAPQSRVSRWLGPATVDVLDLSGVRFRRRRITVRFIIRNIVSPRK